MKLLTNYYLSRFSFIKSRILGSDSSESGLSIPTFRPKKLEVGTPTESVGAGNKTFVSKRSEGFVALISAIIIASVLMIFVVGTGAGGFYTRFDVFGSEIKEISYGLAEACIQTAILKVSQDSSYSGDEVIPVGGESCNICQGSDSSTVIAQGIFDNSYTNLEADINSDFEITDLRELPNHGSTCLSS